MTDAEWAHEIVMGIANLLAQIGVLIYLQVRLRAIFAKYGTLDLWFYISYAVFPVVFVVLYALRLSLPFMIPLD